MAPAIGDMLERRIVLMALTLAVAGCGANPTQPTSPPFIGHIPSTILYNPVCQPEGPNVRCSVKYLGRIEDSVGEFDVTAMATWSLSALPMGDLATTAASIELPGFIVPREGGNISIDATYNGTRVRSVRRFAVVPGRDAIQVSIAVGGWARDPATYRGMPDVTIEMLDGPYAGQTRKTDGSGYFAFDFFPLNIPFTIRASKDGYETVTQHHSGVSDTQETQTLLNILLQRRQ